MDLPVNVELALANMPEKVDYNIDVKPILVNKYFKCYGNDAKKQTANLRLDIASFAYGKKYETVLKAIKPKILNKSEILYRILSDDIGCV